MMIKKGLLSAIILSIMATWIISEQDIKDDLNQYLAPSEGIDSNHPEIIRTAAELTRGASTDGEKAKILYEFVRDMEELKGKPCATFTLASDILRCRINFCYSRSVLLAALCRAANIPARLHLQKVTLKNWLSDGNKTSDLTFAHLLTGLYLDGSWKIYETVGNKDKLAQWLRDENLDEKATVMFHADRDCLFQPDDRIIIETSPLHFTGFNQSLINEIKKIDGGIYLK